MFHKNCRNSMTYQAQKEFSHYFWFHKMLLISHSSRPNWYSAHAGCNQKGFFFFLFFFPKIATILVIWKSSDRETRVKIKLFTITFQFYGPNGTLKIKTGLPTRPISQRALITHGPLITKIPAFDPDWPFSAKCCQSVMIVYWHNCLKANLKHCRKDDW